MTNVAVASPPSIPLPTSLTTYQIYPGGPVYTVGTVPSSASSVTLGPDMVEESAGDLFQQRLADHRQQSHGQRHVDLRQ